MARTSAGGVQSSEIQDSVYTYAADAEASDSYAITLDPAPSAYTAGQMFIFKANTANTGAASLNVNGLGAQTIKKRTGTDLANNDIQSGSIVTVVYDGTNFQMISMLANAPSGSGDMVAATYDPAAISEQLVGLTATQTLTNKTLTTPTVTLKQGTAPTPTAEGDIQWDTDDDKIVVGDGTGQKSFSNDTTNASTYAAASHTHAASDINSGTLTHERGGLEADVSAYAGLIKISGGTTSQAVADTDYQDVLAEGAFVDGDKTKLDGIEASADVTDATNVTAAGALMDSELTDIAFVKAVSDADVSTVNTGTSTTAVPTADSLAGSYAGTKSIQMVVFDFATDVATGDGKFYFRVPPALNGMDIVNVHADVITAGTTGTTDIQLHNVTDAVDILSTKLTIDSTETGSDTAATAAVINTANDDLATNDIIRVDVDAVSTTAPQGLIISFECRLP